MLEKYKLMKNCSHDGDESNLKYHWNRTKVKKLFENKKVRNLQ